MTDEEMIKRVAELDRAATPGPWQTRFLFRVMDTIRTYAQQFHLLVNGTRAQDWADAEFCAESRTLLPAIAAALRATREELARDKRQTDASLWVEALELEKERARTGDEARRELSDLRRNLAETKEVARRLGQAAAQWEIQAQDFRDKLVAKDAEIERLREIAQVATAGLSQEVAALRSRLAAYEPVVEAVRELQEIGHLPGQFDDDIRVLHKRLINIDLPPKVSHE